MAIQGRIAGSVTQTGADAFTQVGFSTALLGITNLAYRVLNIQVEWTEMLPQVTTAKRALQITRRSKAGEVTILDKDLVFKAKQAVRNSGAAYMVLDDLVDIYVPENEILLVEDPIYFAVASSLTLVANSANILITYEQVKISEIDRLTLITQSLT